MCTSVPFPAASEPKGVEIERRVGARQCHRLPRDTHICIFNKMQITGFKHKYPTIEFNSENPKKEC